MKHYSELVQQELLKELWHNAIFDDGCYALLEKIIEKSKQTTRIEDVSLLDDIYEELASVRNRNLISFDEQKKLKQTVVAFFGLSVGSHAALTWGMQIRPTVIKIVDHDTVDITNLNRLRYGLDAIGLKKVELVKEQLAEISPRTKVISIASNQRESAMKLINEYPKTDVLVDAIDDIEGKLLLRQVAKRNNIPLVSAADVGDNVILDVERYDTEPDTEFFLGRLRQVENIDFSTLSGLEKKKLIISLVGFDYNDEKLLDSLLVLGKKLASWPQLGATATLAGAIITTTVKKIVLGESVKSGRYYISLDEILTNNFFQESRIINRNDKILQIKNKFNLK